MLWPNDTVVDFEHGINNTVKKLRRALDDSADQPKYIGTVRAAGLSPSSSGCVEENFWGVLRQGSSKKISYSE